MMLMMMIPTTTLMPESMTLTRMRTRMTAAVIAAPPIGRFAVPHCRHRRRRRLRRRCHPYPQQML